LSACAPNGGFNGTLPGVFLKPDLSLNFGGCASEAFLFFVRSFPLDCLHHSFRLPAGFLAGSRDEILPLLLRLRQYAFRPGSGRSDDLLRLGLGRDYFLNHVAHESSFPRAQTD
jgi:hypothetical protein